MTSGTSRWRRLAPLLGAWGLLVAIETIGQLSLKTAGAKVGAFEPDRASILAALATPWLWVGLCCYLGAFVVWMHILERSALSAAFPTTAITFVTVMLASWIVLREPMGWSKLLGSAIIVAGILLLGSDPQSATPATTRNEAEGNPT